MISKKHFLAQVKKLNIIYPESAINSEQALIYYDVMSSDFTDDQFDVALNLALKNSFKFPPIAAFYKGGTDADNVYAPVTAEESARIRKTLESYNAD